MFENYEIIKRKFHLYNNCFSFAILANKLAIDSITKDLIERHKDETILYADYTAYATYRRIEVPIIYLYTEEMFYILDTLYFLNKKYNIDVMTIDEYDFEPKNVVIPMDINDYHEYKIKNKVKKYKNVVFVEFDNIEVDDIIDIINNIPLHAKSEYDKIEKYAMRTLYKYKNNALCKTQFVAEYVSTVFAPDVIYENGRIEKVKYEGNICSKNMDIK